MYCTCTCTTVCHNVITMNSTHKLTSILFIIIIIIIIIIIFNPYKTRNGYDIWLQAEKQRIKDQLDKFWHYQLPATHTWSHSAPHDYHKAYILLQEKVIWYV